MIAGRKYGRGTGRPHPIDVRIGARLRERRMYLAMNQGALAAHLGLTFQQIQKYESGANRISAGMLKYIAGLLEVPVEYFFRGGNAKPLEREEIGLLRSYHQLRPESAANFLAMMQTAGGAR